MAELAEFLEIAGIEGLEFVVEEDRELAELDLAELRLMSWISAGGASRAPLLAHRCGVNAQALRACREPPIRRVGSGRAKDDGVEIGVDDFDPSRAIEVGLRDELLGRIRTNERPGRLGEVQQRIAVAVDRLVVDRTVAGVADRLRTGRSPGRIEDAGRHLATIPAGVALLGDDGAEQAVGDRAAIPLAAGGRGIGGHEVGAFTVHLELAVDRLARRDGLKAATGAQGLDRRAGSGEATGHGNQPVDRERHSSGSGPIQIRFVGILHPGLGRVFPAEGLAVAQELFIAFGHCRPDRAPQPVARPFAVLAEGLRQTRLHVAQKIAHAQNEHVSGIGSQDERPGPLAVAQTNFSGLQPIRVQIGQEPPTFCRLVIDAHVAQLRIWLGFAATIVDFDDVAAEREDHAERIEGAEAIVDQHMVERRDIGTNDAPSGPGARQALTGKLR
ncbi:hypothetical protein [Jiella avicenniae]|uniref:hypothetical protein n=1 Tax=Jiella avicenniae TaxID=2907202 RepID=UPI001F1E2A55|nr:hypothetical protein [Jiella avicenniae]